MKLNDPIQGRILPWARSLAFLLLTCIAPAAQAQAPDPAAAPSCSADATKGVLDQILRKRMRDFIDTYAVTKNGAVDYKVEKTDDGQLYVTVLQADRPY